jgi:hypothetical protein
MADARGTADDALALVKEYLTLDAKRWAALDAKLNALSEQHSTMWKGQQEIDRLQRKLETHKDMIFFEYWSGTKNIEMHMHAGEFSFATSLAFVAMGIVIDYPLLVGLSFVLLAASYIFLGATIVGTRRFEKHISEIVKLPASEIEPSR